MNRTRCRLSPLSPLFSLLMPMLLALPALPCDARTNRSVAEPSVQPTLEEGRSCSDNGSLPGSGSVDTFRPANAGSTSSTASGLSVPFGASALSASSAASARRGFDPWQSTDEITLSIGMFMPTRGEEGGAQESYRLDYASFGYNNLGYRVGALFTPQLRGIEGCLGIPVQFVWRSRLRGRERWAENWPEAAASTIENRGNPLPGLLLILLPQRVEFGGGVTPGWIFGKEDIHSSRTPAVNDGKWYDEGILRHHPFTLSIDAEMRLTYRIWRFTLSVAPGIHYYITDNFRTYTSFSDRRVDPGRWYFSLYGGLGFMF